MAFNLADLVRETSITTGTGALTLAGAVTGYQAFATAFSNGDTFLYRIQMATNWETGIGTLSAGTLVRTTVLASTNSNNAVNWGAGTKDIICTVPATFLAASRYSAYSASVISIGANRSTNPLFTLDFSAGSVATGVKITGAASGSGVAITATGGTIENIKIDPKGTTGRLLVGTVSGAGASFGGTSGSAYWEFITPAITGGGRAVFFSKTRDATNAVRYEYNDVGGLTGDSGGAAFWRGAQYIAPNITDPVGGASLFPSLSFYSEYNSLSGPSTRNWVFDMGNDTSTSRHTYRLRSGGSDIFTATSTVANFPQSTASTTTSNGAVTIGGGLGVIGTINAATIAATTALTLNGNGVLTVGKHSVWVPASAMIPRTTNGAALGTVEMSSNKNMVKTLDFDASTQEFAQFDIRMPKSWNESTVTFIPVWSHPATVTNFGVVWGLDAVAVSDDDTLDVGFGTEQTSTDTGGTTNDSYQGPESSAITIAGSPAENDYVMFRIHRNPSDGSDTMAVDARLHGVLLFYTINAANDA